MRKRCTLRLSNYSGASSGMVSGYVYVLYHHQRTTRVVHHNLFELVRLIACTMQVGQLADCF